jgi:hypothetical protein
MYRAGIWDGKWTGKDGKTGKRDLGSKYGKVGRDMGLPFFFKPVLLFVKYEPNPLDIRLEMAITIVTIAIVGPFQANPKNEIQGNNLQ